MEIIGTLTHKIPFNKDGVELSTEDMNGETKNSSQKLVIEKTTVPLDKNQFKENEKATEYVQHTHIAAQLRKSLPANSPVNLKDTSKYHTPKDEEIP